ncbi:ArsB/NhaD family transporter [Desulfoscipio gibsoniae]|uniref:Na+/H+ antiporter NhaD-like permease n=1 Tax=Desulfoscipio gibsoniae DSM 7213 TaxID=767817 RepID=R4KBH6_9FIRM|nr:ArsB/NhaD family transporter [Desulfoscipio gibsoniae]AGL00503.1 Na+/H+ antiporter NhaD-like permease [Desulfoscipio gibsoniae DSM 7213]
MNAQIQVIIAGTIFLFAYALIMSEKIHRTVVALAGAILLILCGVFTQQRAIESIDFNTIGLLIGMMVIVGITKATGIFEYLAVYAAKAAKGKPVKIMVFLSAITAICSALLDNVTTVLLIVPVTFAIVKQLQTSPVPFLTAEIMASNIGGTATLIGDPPNIMIGSANGLGFMDFVINLTPVIIIVYIANIICLKVIYKKELFAREDLSRNIMSLEEKSEIKDALLLKKCLFVIFLTILGFILHQYINIASATVALAGATLLLLVSKVEPERALAAVEWPVIFFFTGLFIMVGALEQVGIIEFIAEKSLALTGGVLLPTGLLILWLSAIASAFVDNIPFVAAMIPLIQDMSRLGSIQDVTPLWWALSLGACLGGNGTLIGASANLVVAGMAEKRGIHITFAGYIKIAFPAMLLSIIICTFYLFIFYLR